MKDLFHVVNALLPVADAFAGTKYTDIINMKNFNHITFLIQGGADAVGTSTITIEACDDVAASHVSAIPFTYQECITGDTFGARVKAVNTGFVTAAAAGKMYKIDIDAESLNASGYGYIRLKAVEVVNDPVTCSVIAILNEPRYEAEIFETAIV